MIEQKTNMLIIEAERLLSVRNYKAAHATCIEVLKLSPNAPAPFYLLSILTFDHGNLDKALELVEKAIALSKGKTGRYHAWHGRLLTNQHQRDLAVDAARAAANCPDNSAQTLDTIGVVLSRSGYHSEAIQHYIQATNLSPQNAAYWYNLGAAQQFVGDMMEAELSYTRAIQIDPTSYKAWSSLVSLTKQTQEKNYLSELKTQFRHLKKPDERLNIGHAIAKTYEDLGQIQNQMHWLEKAKKLKFETQAYDIQNDIPLFQAAQKTLHFSYSKYSTSEAAPIFVIGLPRSGTTLVDRILSSHTDVESAGELTDFALKLKKASSTSSPYILDEETLLASQRLDLGQVGRQYLESASKIVPNARRILDKMPLNFFCAPLILQAIPNAKIICVRRHIADSVLSNYKQLFATSFSYYNYSLNLEDTAKYCVQFDKLMAQYSANLPSKKYTEVYYEDIVANTAKAARELVGFCDLEWQDACASFHKNSAPVATASSAQVRQPIYKSALARWKKYEAELEPALRILKEAGIQLD